MKALLLLAFGGPRSLDEVEFLLTRLFRGRKPSAEQLEKVKDRYRLIGGCSPLPDITWKQGEGLEKKLRARGYPFKAYVGMRYCHPLIEETLREILDDGLKEIVALPMAPFQSRASTGAYMDEVTRVNEKLGGEFEVSFAREWHCHPLFIEAVCEKIEEGLLNFLPEERERVHLIFTAHSLPKSVALTDPYVKEMEESVEAVIDKMGRQPWHIAFQSKGTGPEEWIGPDVEPVLLELASHNVRGVLIVPIGFVSDHIEILYDIDIAFQKKAESLGMVLKRSPSLNTSEKFLEALAAVVEEQVREKGFQGSRGQKVCKNL
jgi:protoporphyrin/coproporphyrin ferrochelatase